MRQSALFFALLLAVPLSFTGCGLPGSGVAQQAKNTFTSIRDAIDRSITLRCEYADANGQKTVAYIKGKQVRMDNEPSQDAKQPNFHGLIKDNKMWVWADKEAKGFVLDFSKTKGDEMKMGDKVINSQDDVIAKLEENKDTCKTSTIADSEFNLPAGVEFKGVE